MVARPPGVRAGRACGIYGLEARRRAGRAKDLHPVASGDREQPLHVRGSLHQRRQHPLGCRLADLAQEALEVEGLEADQRLRPFRLGDEGVRHSLGAEREGARRKREAPLADEDGELTLEDVEPFVLVGVNVPGRALAGTDGDFEQAVLAARVGATDLDNLEHPQQPVRLPLVLSEQIAVPRTLCSNNRHLTRSLRRNWYDQQLSMSEQLQSGLSHEEQSLSSPSPGRLRAWRLYFESALALIDVLDAEIERDAGIPLRWYDTLVHLEETPDGLRMNELAERILYSKSGFTRVVDRLEDAGFVRRVRPKNDRRSILVLLTDAGRKTMERARRHHRHGI